MSLQAYSGPQTLTVNLPYGVNKLFLTGTASAGYYQRVANPGQDPYTPTFFTGDNSTINLGPFNEERTYIIVLQKGSIGLEEINNTGLVTTTLGTISTQNASNVSISGGSIGPVGISNSTLFNCPITDVFLNYDSNGTILSDLSCINAIVKEGTAAMSLAEPSMPGTYIRIVSMTNYAHTVSCTDGFINGTSTAKSTATFAAYAGANIMLVANENAKWVVVSTVNVTLS